MIYFNRRPGGHVEGVWPEIVLKTDMKTILFEFGREGKFSAKATGWDENKVIKPGEKIEISLAEGPWLIVKMPPPAPAEREVVEDFLIGPTGRSANRAAHADCVSTRRAAGSFRPLSDVREPDTPHSAGARLGDWSHFSAFHQFEARRFHGRSVRVQWVTGHKCDQWSPPFTLARQFVDHALELARHLKIVVRFSLRFAACTIKHHGQQRGATMGCRRLAPRFWPWSIQRVLLPV
jgi:hypothetical protein